MPKVHDIAVTGGRRGRGARVVTSLAEINVVPLIDVMLVLLIIFMVTAPMMQQGLQVNLPQTATEADKQILIGLMLLAFALAAGSTFVFWRGQIAALVTSGVRRHGR